MSEIQLQRQYDLSLHFTRNSRLLGVFEVAFVLVDGSFDDVAASVLLLFDEFSIQRHVIIFSTFPGKG